MPPAYNFVVTGPETQLLIAVFRQWSTRIDSRRLASDLGIHIGAANMRLIRLRARLLQGRALPVCHTQVLLALVNQERHLPRLSFRQLGTDLGIRPAAAAMRWFRLKRRLRTMRDRITNISTEAPIPVAPAPYPTIEESIGNDELMQAEALVNELPYDLMRWLEDEP